MHVCINWLLMSRAFNRLVVMDCIIKYLADNMDKAETEVQNYLCN